jgi:hypothetical protein
MTLALNTSYLNKTPNKTRRTGGPNQLHFVVWHETAGGGSLEWNLRPDVQSSYNYLIARDGTIYHYVDERTHIAWHAGAHSRWTIDRAYTGAAVNRHSVGVELEGPNTGEPITTAQRDSAVALMRFLYAAYQIPLAAAYHPSHKAVAPFDSAGNVYKTDPRGYSVAVLLSLASKPPPPPADALVIGVAPSISLAAFRRALLRNGEPLNIVETERVYTLCSWLDLDPAFLLALWLREGGRPLGSSPLQQQTRGPINIKAAPGEWRPTAGQGGAKWLAFESWQLGAMAAIIHLKNVYGWSGQHTVRQIVPILAPTSDGNDVERYIASVLEDMAYMRSH